MTSDHMFTRSGARGVFRAEQKGDSWHLHGPNGRIGTPIPESTVGSIEIAAMLEAYAAGKKYSPVTVDPVAAKAAAQRRDQAAETIETGRDHCFSVSRHVRKLAKAEHAEGGTFNLAVHSQTSEQWPGFERELFARLHGGADPIGESPDADEWLRALHGQVDQVPEWRQLQAYCQNDPWAAGIGAGSITKALGASVGPVVQKAPQEDAERVREDAAALEAINVPAEATVERAVELEEHGAVTALRIRGAEVANRQAVGIAVTEALGEIQELQAGMGALGVGNQPGVASRVAAPSAQVRKLLQGNPRVRRIAQIAGRLKMRAREAQRTKVNYVPEQIVDVTVGAEIQRLLPSETMLLADGETELLLLKKLLERQALEYRLEGRESLDRGPVILCVDGSGSMAGARHEWAMGVALALMEICAKQKRPFALIHFDALVQKEYLVTKPADLNLEQLVEMVTYFSDGGTNFGPPLQRALTLIERDRGAGVLGKADVVLLTDGGGHWDKSVANLKRRGAGVYGVAIATDFTAEQKAELTGVAHFPNLNPKAEAALDVVFGGI